MKVIFSCIGTGTVIAFVFILLILIFKSIDDLVYKMKWKHKYKHRFDKPPTAKCYCKDCKSWDPVSKKCYAHEGWYTADSWFCWNANPLDKEREEEK